MKFRTCLLAVCMVVVPTLAMFSHHLPADTRRSVRDCVHGVHGWFAGTLASIGNPSVSTAAAPEAGNESPAPAVDRDAGRPDVAATGLQSSVVGLPESRPVVGSPPLKGPPPLPGSPSPPASLDEAVRHLTVLGAESIECVTLPSQAGRHLASCRMPLDAERQLHRVFQTEGVGAEAAMRRLLDDVTAWQRRIADRAAAAGPDGRPAGGRF